MAHDNVIFQGDFQKLSEGRKLFIGSKSDTWKPKHVIVHIKENSLVLELHKKKPKASKKSDKTLTDSHDLPSFKVEKLKNARGRSFVCEITAPNFHLFLSADEEKQIDVLVYMLQTQLRLKEEIRDDILRVVPENTECQKKIGAKGSNCLLHISPWGLTLVLERSRCLLAQWPLKSIRYYEASGTGLFTIEAGRVAPMGEGVFGFQTLSGEDDLAYDKVDNYIVNTLDRVKPNQRGTKEEIEDYIREHDNLHALTVVRPTPVTAQRDIRKALKLCWDIGRGGETFTDAVLDSRSAGSGETSASSNSHTSSLNVTLERLNMGDSASGRNEPESRRTSLQSESKSSSSSGSSRPPLPLAKSNNGGVPRRSRRRDHSIPRKVDVVEVDTYGTSPRVSPRPPRQANGAVSRSPELPPRPSASSSSSSSPSQKPRRHSNPANILHQVSVSSTDSSASDFNLLHPYINQPHSHQHTEFYNLNSPNLKVRKNKSPVINTRHRNMVGRAELLLSMDQSGVRTPSTSSPPTLDYRTSTGSGSGFEGWDLSGLSMTDEEHRDQRDYQSAIARVSQQKYGHNSIDRTWAKLKRDHSVNSGEGDDLTDGPKSPSGGYANAFPPAGYVNLQKLASMEENSVASASHDANASTHKRQSSLDASTSSSMLSISGSPSRRNSKASQQGEATLSPPSPAIRHGRQRSAPVEGSVSSASSLIPTATNPGYLMLPDETVPEMDVQGQSSDEAVSGISLRGGSGKNRSRNSESSIGGGALSSSRQVSQLSGFSTFDQVDAPVAEWLISASCEDLSDHMRHVIYDDDGGATAEKGADGGDEENDDIENTYDEIHSDKEDKSDNSSSPCTTLSRSSNDKPPLPFTGLKKFQNKVDMGSPRDRSKSFGYISSGQGPSSPSANQGNANKPQSTAPSAHLIRKMVAARAKQDSSLRKSLSNPNFLNLGSKEHLFTMKTVGSAVGSSNNLQANTKQKSRSFSSLFPAIKKALSRESVSQHSRSTTPERRSSFSLRRRSSEHELRRRSSLHAPGEMTIKGIRMTERSRSFRRVRGAKSVEGLSSKSENEATDTNRLSTPANASSPPPDASSLPSSQQNSEAGASSPARLRNNANHQRTKSSPRSKNGRVESSSSSEKPGTVNSNQSASISSPPPTPASSRFSSNISVNLSESMDSMSPAPSPSYLPPPPIPARKPRVSESARNSATSNVVSTPSSSPSKHKAGYPQNKDSPSRSTANYMNSISVSINNNDKPKLRPKERRESAPSATTSSSATTSLSTKRSNRRVSDKIDEAAKELGFAPSSPTSKFHKEPFDSKRVVSAGEVPIPAAGAASNDSKTTAKRRSSKIASKS